MENPFRLLAAASVAALTFLSAGASLAQGTANTGTGTTAAPTTTTTTTTTATAPEAATADKGKAAPKKKKKPVRETRQQEIDRSVDQGTVPARYRSQVPKEYQQYVPFDKR